MCGLIVCSVLKLLKIDDLLDSWLTKLILLGNWLTKLILLGILLTKLVC